MRKQSLNIYFIFLSLFFIVSITAIYSFCNLLNKGDMSLVIRQALFYLIGFIIIILILRIGGEKIIRYSYAIYLVNLVLLILVLFLGTRINGARAWFTIPLVGSFQPSEFMKIGIILVLADILEKAKYNTFKDELKTILKVFLVVLVPSVFTFLEPDTGAVIIYFIIAFFMLFISKIRIRWFILFFIILAVVIGLIGYLFYFKSDLFIKVFGSSLFYRIDRITNWASSSGMQLENSLISIGAAGIFGTGIENIALYYPEGQTDFIFTSFTTSFGIVGALILLLIIFLFNLKLVKDINDSKSMREKLIVSGFLGIVLFQQLYNISMTIGLVPIMGITLPFISYGGSSLISFMILIGIIISLGKKYEKQYKINYY